MLLATRNLLQLLRCQRAGVPLIATRQALWQQLVTARRQEVHPRLLLRRRLGLTMLQRPVRRQLIRTLAWPLSPTLEKLQARVTALRSRPTHKMLLPATRELQSRSSQLLMPWTNQMRQQQHRHKSSHHHQWSPSLLPGLTWLPQRQSLHRMWAHLLMLLLLALVMVGIQQIHPLSVTPVAMIFLRLLLPPLALSTAIPKSQVVKW